MVLVVWSPSEAALYSRHECALLQVGTRPDMMPGCKTPITNQSLRTEELNSDRKAIDATGLVLCVSLIGSQLSVIYLGAHVAGMFVVLHSSNI